jgi:hypothetical protein
MKTLLPQISSLDSIFILFRIASFIFYPFIAFAQCAIVISDLSVSSSLPMVFQALKKDAFTVIVLVVIFGVISYFLAVTYRGIEGNLGGTAFYYIAQLIVNVIQSAVFTFAYFYCIGDAKPETSTSNLPT